jgi:PPOX class probable F420-dependent enzyme
MMSILTAEARALLESNALAHLVTLNPDGSPQLSCVWVAVDGEEILSGHMLRRKKVRNVERDERVVLSIEGQVVNSLGLREYLVVHGRARVQAGGAAALLQTPPLREQAEVEIRPALLAPARLPIGGRCRN